MKNTTKGKIMRYSSVIILDVGAPLAVTFYYFPVWVERSAGATVSGIFLVLALLCIIPLMLSVKRKIKTPAVWVMWTIVFVLLWGLNQIIAELLAVAGVGAVSNILGSILYKTGEYIENKP